MSDDEPRPLPVAAFFDIDKTLVNGASLLFLARAARSIGIVKIRDLVRFGFEAARFRRRGEHLGVLDKVRDRGMSMLAGTPAERLHDLAGSVVLRMQVRLWPDTQKLIRTHLECGHQVWLISATPDFLAQTLAESLGATGGLGSPLEIRDGVFTGSFTGPTMHGAQKGVAARALMQREGLDPADCYAYSDSVNDLPLLESVGTAVAINPDRDLERIARERGWRGVTLDPASLKEQRRSLRRSRQRG